MSERLFNIGYVGMAVETVPGVALAPTDFAQAYDFDVTTMRNLEELAPAAGNVYSTQQVVAGLRSHGGSGTFIFEPNTFEKFAAMTLAQQSRSGAGPYTGVYGLSSSNPPGKTYTMEVGDGVSAIRYYGCQVSKLATAASNNEVQMKPTISAIGTFNGREVASVAGTTPYVITLKTDYDPAPTTGIVVGDKMHVYANAGGAITQFTVSAVTPTTISTTTAVTPVAGDMVRLTSLTPAFNMLPPVLWSNTHFYFGTTASAALAGTETRVEPGSMWEIDFDFKDDKGEHRSGGQDPATLLRKPGKVTLTIKKYYDTPADIETYNSLVKSACVIRHYVYSGGQTYEVRVTLNHLVTNDPTPKWKSGEINYSEIKYICQFDQTDGQAFSVTVVDANTTLT
jgi:hypothetical protein